MKDSKIVLYGQKDELYEIISGKLKAMDVLFTHINDTHELKKYNSKGYVIITWSPEHLDLDRLSNCIIVNILS